MPQRFPDRRRVTCFLLALAASLTGRALAAPKTPKDRGIGGTGVAPADPERKSDRGIGGTGVIGTIQDFGSIIVNGLRISYPQDVAVRIDGRPATIAELKRGHVVRVVALGPNSGLSTTRIDVTSEVVGVVERATPQELRVMGQTVSFGVPVNHGWEVGDRVAVSGLRRGDGAVVPSLIELRPVGALSVAGPVTRNANGQLTIGGLTLSGAPATILGQRAIVSGSLIGETFQVQTSEAERLAFGGAVRRLSIEAYVVQSGNGLRLGSGLQVSGGVVSPGLRSPAGERRIIGGTMGQGGQVHIDSSRPMPERNPASGDSGMRGLDPGAPAGPGGGGNRPGGQSPGGAPAGGFDPGNGPSGYGAPGGPGSPGGSGTPGGPGGRTGPGGRR